MRNPILKVSAGFSQGNNYTLRDKMATAAMQGILASGLANPRNAGHFNNIAEDSYMMADSMLKFREL